MKNFLIIYFLIFLSSGIVTASDEIYDSFKGSFGMYDVSAEMAVLKKIESMTDPDTEKMMIGDLELKFDYIEHELAQDKGLQVAFVHFTDKEDKYILTFHVDGNSVVKITFFSRNEDFINKLLYSAENPDKKEECSEEKKESK